jgi:outer membrane protein assembly factor BamB
MAGDTFAHRLMAGTGDDLMRTLILAGFLAVLLAFLATDLTAQDRTQVYSNPALPPREGLDRMNLTQAWFTVIPMDGRKDGFLAVQSDGKQLFVQTKSGIVAVIDAETGRTLWRTLPGQPYEGNVPLSYNTYSVYVLNATDLYALDRRTGQPQWQFRLPGGLSTAPIADDEQIYLCGSNTRLYASRVPKYDVTGRYVSSEIEQRLLGGTLPSAETREFLSKDNRTAVDPTIPPELYKSTALPPVGPRPRLMWEVMTSQQLEFRPLLSKEIVMVSGNNPATGFGRLMAFTKFPQSGYATEIFRFPLEGYLIAAPGGYENTAYVGGSDALVYAVSMDSGRVEWRTIVGDPIVRAPVATAKDVYVTSNRNGMTRLDRETGAPMWRVPAGRESLEYNNEVDRYLASNPKFVYAMDRAGRFLVVDRLQGKTLSRYDLTCYVYPIVNEYTDRIFLAANNGMIVCLHDKEYAQPFQHRKVTSEAENLQLKLAKLITMPPVAPTPFRNFIREFEKNNELKIIISDRAFGEANRGDALIKPITLPAITNRPVSEVLQLVLQQIDATSIVVRDTILIAPKGGGPPVPMPPRP